MRLPNPKPSRYTFPTNLRFYLQTTRWPYGHTENYNAEVLIYLPPHVDQPRVGVDLISQFSRNPKTTNPKACAIGIYDTVIYLVHPTDTRRTMYPIPTYSLTLQNLTPAHMLHPPGSTPETAIQAHDPRTRTPIVREHGWMYIYNRMGGTRQGHLTQRNVRIF